MDSTPLPPLAAFRQGAYACFTRAGDALFEVVDALLTEDHARSFVELSQAPGCQRQWPSLYAALRDGQIDRDALRRLMVERLPRPAPGDRLGRGVDTSPIHRPEAHTAADRTWVYSPNLPAGSVPARPGWSFSTVAVLPDPPSSWTSLLDNARVPSTGTATTVGAAQLATRVPLVPVRPLLLGDGHDGSTAWVVATGGLACDQLLRTKRDRVLYRPAPPRTGNRGAPKKDGARFKGSDPTTHDTPDAVWTGTDAAGHACTVTAWCGLHLKSCRDVPLTVLRVTRAGAVGTARDPRESWFWWLGGEMPPLATIPPLYARRFGLEHGDRFDKQALLWEAPRLRTPERFQTVDRSGRARSQSGGAGPSHRHRHRAPVGRHDPPGHPTPGAARDATDCGAGRHTGPPTATPRKIAGTDTGDRGPAGAAPSRHPQASVAGRPPCPLPGSDVLTRCADPPTARTPPFVPILSCLR